MFNRVLQLTVLTYIWKRYRGLIVSTLLLFAYIWLVGKLHDDFISYSQLNDEANNVGLSFIVKWLAFLAGVLVYVFVNARRGQQNGDGIAAVDEKPAAQEPVDPSDPFATLREKEKLRSRADMLIEKKSPRG